MDVSIQQPVETVTIDDDVEVLPTEIINLSIDSSDDEETDQVSVISIATTAGEGNCARNLDGTKVKDSSGEVKDTDGEFWETIKTEDEDVNSYVVPYLQSFAPFTVNNTNNIEIINDEDIVEEHLESSNKALVVDPVSTSENDNMGSQHVCPECNFEASERPSYLQHLKDVHGAVLHECPYCPSKYLHEEFLLSHVRQIHFQLSKLKCRMCQGSYDNYTQLRSHLTTSHDCNRSQLVENVDFEYDQDNVQECFECDDQNVMKTGREHQKHKRHLRSIPANKLGNIRISDNVVVNKHTDTSTTASIKDKNVSKDVVDNKKMFNSILNHLLLLHKFPEHEKEFESVRDGNESSENTRYSSSSMLVKTEQGKEVGKDARLKIYQHDVDSVKKSTQLKQQESRVMNASVLVRKSGYAEVKPTSSVKEARLEKTSLKTCSVLTDNVKFKCAKTEHIDNVMEIVEPDLDKTSFRLDVEIVQRKASACLETREVGNANESIQPSLEDPRLTTDVVVETGRLESPEAKHFAKAKETTQSILEKTCSDPKKSKSETTKSNPVSNVKKNTQPSVEESANFDDAVVEKIKPRCGNTKQVVVKVSEEPSVVKTNTDRESVTSVAQRKSTRGKTKQIDKVKKSLSLEETNFTTDDTLLESTKSACAKAADIKGSTHLSRGETTLRTDSESVERKRSECSKAKDAQSKAEETNLTTDKALITKRKPADARVKRHVCYVCNSSFIRENELVMHTRSQHVDYEVLECIHCDSTFGYFWALRRHMRTHHGIIQVSLHKDFKFVAKISNRSPKKVKAPSKNRNSLEVDLYKPLTKKTRSITKRNVECNRDDVVSTKIDLTINSRMFSCGNCNFTTRRKMKLKNHITEVHTSPLSHRCSYCEKSYTTTTELTSHLQRFHKYSESLLCLRCNRKFKYMKLLREHARDRHGKTAPLSPDIDFKVIEEMLNSVGVTDGKRPRKFRCVRCGFKSGKHQMRAHIKTHRPINILKKAHHNKGPNVCHSPDDHSYYSAQGTVDLLRINRKIQRRNSAIRAGALECEKRTVFVAKPFGSLKDESCNNDFFGVSTTPEHTVDIVSEIVEVPKIIESQENICDFSGKITASEISQSDSLPITEMSLSPVNSSEQYCKMGIKSGVPEEQDIQDVVINLSEKTTTEEDDDGIVIGLKEPTTFCVETSVDKKRKFSDEIEPATTKKLKVESVMYRDLNMSNVEAVTMKSTLLLNQTEKMENVESPSTTILYTDRINMVNSRILDIQDLENKGINCVDEALNTLSKHVVITNKIEKTINSLQDCTVNPDDIEVIIDRHSMMHNVKLLDTFDTKLKNTKESDLGKITVHDTSQEKYVDDVITISDSPTTVNEDSIEREKDILNDNQNPYNKIAINIDASLEEPKYAIEKNIFATDIDGDVKSGCNTKKENHEVEVQEIAVEDNVDHKEETLSITITRPCINNNEASEDMENDDDIIFVNTYIENERNINNIEFLEENASEQSTTSCDSEEYMDVSVDMDVKECIDFKRGDKSLDLVTNGKSESIVDTSDKIKYHNRSPRNLIYKLEDSLQIKNENANNCNMMTPAAIQTVYQNDQLQDRTESTVGSVSKISKSKLIRVLSDVSLTTLKPLDGNCPIVNCYCEDCRVAKQTLNAETSVPTNGISNALNDHNSQLDCDTTKDEVGAAENIQVMPNNSFTDVSKTQQVKSKNKKPNRKRNSTEVSDINFSNTDVEEQIRKLKYIKISSTNNILESECYTMGRKPTGKTLHRNDSSTSFLHQRNTMHGIVNSTEPGETTDDAPSSDQCGGAKTDELSQCVTSTKTDGLDTTCNDDNVPALHKAIGWPQYNSQFLTEAEHFSYVRQGRKRQPVARCDLCHFRHPSSRCVIHHELDRGLRCRYCEVRCPDLLTLRHHLTSAHKDIDDADISQPGKEGTKGRSIMLESDVLIYERVNVTTPGQEIRTLYRKDGSSRLYEVEEAYVEYEAPQISSKVKEAKPDDGSRLSRSKAEIVNVNRSKNLCEGGSTTEGHVEMVSDMLAADDTVSETPPLKVASAVTTTDISVMPDKLNTRASLGRRKKAPARKVTILRK